MDTQTVDIDDCGLTINGEIVVCCRVEAVVEVDYDERGSHFGECRQLNVTFTARNDRPDSTVTIEVDDFSENTRNAIRNMVEPAFSEMLADGGDGK